MKMLFKKYIPAAIVLFSLFFFNHTDAQNPANNKQDIQTQTPNKTLQEDQTFTRNADEWTTNLSNELNLTPDQSDTVRTIMIDYQRQRAAFGEESWDDTRTNEFNSTFNRRIESLLDDEQVNTFNVYRETWWQDIDTGIRDPNNLNAPEQDNQDQNNNYRLEDYNLRKNEPEKT